MNIISRHSTAYDIAGNAFGLPYCTEGAGLTMNYTYDHLSRPASIVITSFEEHLTYSPGRSDQQPTASATVQFLLNIIRILQNE